jgi:hypothetical protein
MFIEKSASLKWWLRVNVIPIKKTWEKGEFVIANLLETCWKLVRNLLEAG